MTLLRRPAPATVAAAVIVAGACLLSAADALARVLEVGPGRQYERPSDAARDVRDGDEVVIAAGVYEGDVAVWRANDLTIRSTGGLAHMKSNGATARGKAVWLVTGGDVTISGIQFSGAESADKNGAGIRLEGAGPLTVRDSVFHDNQMGILSGNEGTARIVIENSEFYRNGETVSGSYRVGHNIYIGRAASFELRFSSVHHAVRGHNVKSRAARNVIAYNEIADMIDGTSSYLIDLPEGGDSVVIGNVLQQGPGTDNYTLVSFGAEKKNQPLGTLSMAHNTLINQNGDGIFVANHGTEPALLVNNLYQGPGTLVQGPHRQEAFLHVPARIGEKGAVATVMEKPSQILSVAKSMIADGGSGGGAGASLGFRDPLQLDFHLTARSPAVDAGRDAGSAPDGTSLTPTHVYVHPLAGAPRRQTGTAPDLGAYEYEGD
ncbi:right-handed parallel beta-helix repeat-containing protein [Caenispirillum bisanense]|uniref:right-handed parallel beta-helix repeat-containing protein n=1 Tax=Caenispirillum bisanense TaxID=414052 RepID=UPI0031DB0440